MSPSVEERRAVEEAEEDHRRQEAMAEHDRRGKKLDDELEAARLAGREATNRLNTANRAVVDLQRQLTMLPARARETLEQLRETAAEKFDAVVENSPFLSNMAQGAPSPPPAGLAELHLLIDDGLTFLERLGRCIDDAPRGLSRGEDFTDRAEETIRAELEDARKQVSEAKRENAEAQERLRELAPRVRARAMGHSA